MKWGSHPSTAQQHSMPWNSCRRTAWLRKNPHPRLGEPFSCSILCVYGCYLVLKMKHKSKINSDVPTCHPSLMAFQSKGQNCHLQGIGPEVRFVLWPILLLPTVRHLYKLTSLLPLSLQVTITSLCSVTVPVAATIISSMFWHLLALSGSKIWMSQVLPQGLHGCTLLLEQHLHLGLAMRPCSSGSCLPCLTPDTVSTWPWTLPACTVLRPYLCSTHSVF